MRTIRDKVTTDLTNYHDLDNSTVKEGLLDIKEKPTILVTVKSGVVDINRYMVNTMI